MTKVRLVDQAQLDRVIASITSLVAGTVLANQPPLAVSAAAGTGIDALRARLVQAAGELRGHADGGPPRLAVDRAFVVDGVGHIVAGTLLGTVWLSAHACSGARVRATVRRPFVGSGRSSCG